MEPDMRTALMQMDKWENAFPYEDAAVRFPLAADVFGTDFADTEENRGKWQALGDLERVEIADSAVLETDIFGVAPEKFPDTEILGSWTRVLLPGILPPGLTPETSKTERGDGLRHAREILRYARAARTRSKIRMVRESGFEDTIVNLWNESARMLEEGDPQKPPAAAVAARWSGLAGDLLGELAAMKKGGKRLPGVMEGIGAVDVAGARRTTAWILMACNVAGIEARLCAHAKEQGKATCGGSELRRDIWKHLDMLKGKELRKPGSSPP